eukprot:1139197-Pelagomonas_calceolata.AAC.4
MRSSLLRVMKDMDPPCLFLLDLKRTGPTPSTSQSPLLPPDAIAKFHQLLRPASSSLLPEEVLTY